MSLRDIVRPKYINRLALLDGLCIKMALELVHNVLGRNVNNKQAGRRRNTIMAICMKCDGEGKVTGFNDLEECRRTCPVCEGEGQLQTFHETKVEETLGQIVKALAGIVTAIRDHPAG